MNDIEELLYELEHLNISLWVEDTKLFYDIPEDIFNSELIEKIRRNKDEIIQYLNKRKKYIPLSLNQEQLWFFEQVNPNTPTYNIPGAIVIDGEINIELLKECVQRVAERHDSLRTVFVRQEGKLKQRIEENTEYKFAYEDLEQKHLSETSVSEYIQKEARIPFDLLEGVPLRMKLWKRSAGKFILQITIHHIIADGWSMNLLTKELLEEYECSLDRRKNIVCTEREHYKDFIAWQNQSVNEKMKTKELKELIEEIKGSAKFLNLPYKNGRLKKQTWKGNQKRLMIPCDIYDSLKGICKEENVTVFHILLTVFETLLYKYTNQTDFVLGLLSANRENRNQDSIGYYVNTVPLIVQIGERCSFQDNLNAAKQSFLTSLKCGDVPFIKVVEHLNLERSLSYNPVFQVLVAHERREKIYGRSHELAFEYILVDSEKSKFDLTLFISESDRDMELALEYNSDLFDEASIEKMLDHFMTLLMRAMENPESGINDLSLLSEEDLKEILFERNHTDVNYPLNLSLNELFEQQVEKTPQHTAVHCPGAVHSEKELSYSELNERANQLGNYLRHEGIGPDLPVGICMERSLEMVIAIMAVIKAGGAYIPLDPEYPKGRLNRILEDSGPSVILTQSHLEGRLPEKGIRIISIEEEWGNIETFGKENLSKAVDENNLAYVIYTSGSTGSPKGVMNHHKGICNRLLWMKDQLHIMESDRILQKTPFSFDVSVWEFFLPLISGARLVMAKPGGHKDCEYLADTILEHKISLIHFVPTMLGMFLGSDKMKQCSQILKNVVCSGEALTWDLQSKFFELLGEVGLYNFYGPTEAAIDVAYWKCRKDYIPKTVPIGRPISNTQLYILDQDLKPVPNGVSGELYIGGVNLARGYWNNPVLTEEAFILHPFHENTGERIYKTGDRARYLSDGNIEFLGREDFQVKINGFRIETEEIEFNIKQTLNVETCVVNALNKGESAQLAAYIVPKKNAAVQTDDIRRFLLKQLPEYMIPVYFIIIDEIPFTPNGKVDRNALPIPDKERPELKTPYTEPETELEKKLAGIWRQILKIEEVGIYDNFFELGGDSIRSIQAAYHAKEEGLIFSVEDIFRYKTISGLLKVLRVTDDLAQTSSDLKPFALLSKEDYEKVPFGAENVFPLSLIQAGLVYNSQSSQDYSAYTTKYTVKSPFHEGLFHRAISRVAQRQHMLRTSFDFSSYSQPMQLVHSDVSHRLKVYDLKALSKSRQEKEIADWLYTEKQKKFTWDTAPLFRFYVHLLTDETFSFTIVEPFLDGWSVSVLASEIFEYYNEFRLGNELFSKGPLKSTYADYAALEQETINSGSAKAFWLNKLEDSVKTILPRWPQSNHEVPEKNELLRRQIVIEEETFARLKKLSNDRSVSLKTTLLAVHIRVMQVMTGRLDIITGLLANGRPEQWDGDQIVGLFLNAQPFCIKAQEGNWYDLINQVEEEERETLSYRRYPFAKIQEEQNNVLFDTLFNYIHFHQYEKLNQYSMELLDITANDQTYFPLTVQFAVNWDNTQLRLSLDYNNTEFSSGQIEHILSYYIRYLNDIVNHPYHDYNSDILYSEKEKELFQDGREFHKGSELCKSYKELFEEQVLKYGDNIAVGDSKEAVTYRELNARANRMARALLAQGIGNHRLVSLYMERSIDFLIAVLAVFKIGGAYIPLDKKWPYSRIRKVLDQSDCTLLMIKDKDSGIKNEICGVDIISVEKYLEEDMDENLSAEVFPDDLAYVIYTSGSTGEPKGAMIEQRGMINHLYAKIEDLGLDETSVTAQTASQCFDISVWQYLANLLVGGRVEVAENEVVRDPLELVKFIKGKEITVFEAVPSILKVILEQINSHVIGMEYLRDLKWLLVTGESFPADLCRAWFCIYPDIPVVNAYGPTECSDDVTHFIAKERLDDSFITVPIGSAVRNTRIHIFNQRLQRMPIGVPGELYVEGIGVGRGYMNHAELTEKSFLVNPLNHERMYKTGDLARCLPDGSFECLGRMDQQIKIRGFRIEIGEIETTLRCHPAVKDSVVVLKEIQNQKELAAYYVLKDKKEIDLDELRNFLRSQLPEYMVPVYFLGLDSLPVNENGKISLSKLPEPVKIKTKLKNHHVLPRNSFEEMTAKVWEEVLNLSEIGIYDNFFEIGGHSLQAMQLVSKLSSILKQTVSIQFIFQHPTIAEISREFSEPDDKNIELKCAEQPVLKKEPELKQDLLCHSDCTEQPLDRLYNMGKLDSLDAVSIGYLPETLLKDTGLSKDEIVQGWFGKMPAVRRIFTTDLGRIGHITLPVFVSEIYENHEKLIHSIVDGMQLGKHMGAKTVSLTGLLPSATNYGRDVSEQIREEKNLPLITTGHAATVSAFVFTIEHILKRCNAPIEREHVGLLGIGSIGLASLRLMLQVLPHPFEITICDLYGKEDVLFNLREEIINDYHFKGNVNIISSRGVTPEQFYNSTMILGAVSMPDILDVQMLREGTIIVDDSAPHCFNQQDAVERLESKADILFTEAGILRLPKKVHELKYLPKGDNNPFEKMVQYRNSDFEIMGCIYSSILAANFKELEASLGMVDPVNCLKHYNKLKELGCGSAGLSCRDYFIPEEIIESFKRFRAIQTI